MKRASRDATISSLCIKNHDHMYTSCDMEWDRQFFVILGQFMFFYLTIDPEN